MKTTNTFIFLISALLLPGLSFAQTNGIDQVNPEEVASLIAEGAMFVDVRETNEVEVLSYDLPGVVNLPLSELPERIDELPRDQRIILACRSGKRSMKAIALLRENDFAQLTNLKGGIVAWEAAQLSVTKIDRDLKAPASGKKQCCSGKKNGKAGKGACCSGKEGAAGEKASCGKMGAGMGKGKGKSCCSGGA